MASNLKRLTATGAVVTGHAILRSVILHGGSANSTLLVQDTTAGGGTDILSLAAVIGSSAVWQARDAQGVDFNLGIYATLAGTGASCTFEYE